VAVPGDPRLWVVKAQRLYLFSRVEARELFLGEAETVIAAAEETWPAVARTLAP
jgi:hypothetical protein